VTDKTVTVSTAAYDGPNNGTLSVTATSSDPTAVLTLVGFGPSAPEKPRPRDGTRRAGNRPRPGGERGGPCPGLMAAPAKRADRFVQGRPPAAATTETARGMSHRLRRRHRPGGGGTPVIGTPVAVNETATMNERTAWPPPRHVRRGPQTSPST
jgi:hypothetical protein